MKIEIDIPDALVKSHSGEEDLEREVKRALATYLLVKGQASSREVLPLLEEEPPTENFKELLLSMPVVGRDEDFARRGDPPGGGLG